MERRFAKAMAVLEPRPSTFEFRSNTAEAQVVADNWGGQFEQEDASSPPLVMADNWGGLFEQPAHISEERDSDLSADIVFPRLATTVQIRVGNILSSTIAYAPDDLGQELVLPLPRGSESAYLGSVLESDLVCPELFPVDAATTDYSPTDTAPAVPVALPFGTSADATSDSSMTLAAQMQQNAPEALCVSALVVLKESAPSVASATAPLPPPLRRRLPINHRLRRALAPVATGVEMSGQGATDGGEERARDLRWGGAGRVPASVQQPVACVHPAAEVRT